MTYSISGVGAPALIVWGESKTAAEIYNKISGLPSDIIDHKEAVTSHIHISKIYELVELGMSSACLEKLTGAPALMMGIVSVGEDIR